MKKKDEQLHMESLMYRMDKLDEKVEELKWLISGTKAKYMDRLRTKNGRLSQKLLNSLIDDLIDCIAEYRLYKETEALTEKEMEFYRSYLYLLMGICLYDNNGYVSRWCHPGTWDAVIERAEEPIDYRSSEEIARDLLVYLGSKTTGRLGPLRFPQYFFLDLADICTLTQGKKLIGAQDRKAARAMMTDEELREQDHPEQVRRELEAEEKAWQAEAWEELEARRNAAAEAGEESLLDDDEPAPEDMEDYLALPDNDHYTAWPDSSPDAWDEYFTDEERLLASGRTVCRLFCETGLRERIPKEVPAAIRLYLSRNGLSDWMNDDRFFVVYTYLNKAVRASRENMRKG